MEYLYQAYEKLFGGSTDLITDGAEPVYQSPRKVVCFGNVLLDRTFKLEDEELLKRHELELGAKGELDLDKLNAIISDATKSSSSDVVSNPGGSALNTVRILKELGTQAQFFGSIGSDNNGEELRSILQQQGIEARLQTVEDADTGLCICLMHNDSPTLFANIGASSRFSVDQLTTPPLGQNFLRPIERKQILYIEGYFVPQRLEVCNYIMHNLVRDRHYLAVNLSAPYIVKENSEMLLQLVNRALFVFGNRGEFQELANCAGCKDIEELARQLMSLKLNKILLITNGANGVQLATNYQSELDPPGEMRFEDYRAQTAERTVDGTGAGDAFAAGFLHSWLEKRSLSECIRQASTVAAKVVTQIGCNMP